MSLAAWDGLGVLATADCVLGVTALVPAAPWPVLLAPNGNRNDSMTARTPRSSQSCTHKNRKTKPKPNTRNNPKAGMSDDEHDVGLPKSSVGRYLRDTLPAQTRCSQETRDLIATCCTEFIHMVATQANKIATEQGKTMLTANIVTAALDELGFGAYVDQAAEAGASFRAAAQSRKSSRQRAVSQEDLLREQEALWSSIERENTMLAAEAAATAAAGASAGGAGAAGAPFLTSATATAVAVKSVQLLDAMDNEIYDEDEV